MKFEVKTLAAAAAGEIELDDTVFGKPARIDILHRVVAWQLEKRRGTARAAAERSDVSRTGKKLGNQKGGGSARHGNRAAPQFIGGGKAHGPRVRDFNPSLNKKIRRLGLATALSVKAAEGKLIVVENLELAEAKTKLLAKAAKELGWKKVLIIDGADVNENFAKAARNIEGIDVLPSMGANVYDILRRETLVLTKAGVEALEARLK